MTEDEQREAERENANKALKDELDTANEKIASLERERALAKYQRSFMEQKYDADASAAMAKALVDGDTEGLLKALGKANEAIVQSAKTELLRNTPLPAAGDKGKEPASDSEVLAKQIGERRAATDKAATDIIAQYI